MAYVGSTPYGSGFNEAAAVWAAEEPQKASRKHSQDLSFNEAAAVWAAEARCFFA